MPALRPIEPKKLKKIMELHGYVVVGDTTRNWALASTNDDEPIIIPKRGKLVAVEIMMDALSKAKIDNATYFSLLSKANELFPSPPDLTNLRAEQK